MTENKQITISSEGITFPEVDGKSMGINADGGLWSKGLSEAEHENIRIGFINTGKMIAARDEAAYKAYMGRVYNGDFEYV